MSMEFNCWSVDGVSFADDYARFLDNLRDQVGDDIYEQN